MDGKEANDDEGAPWGLLPTIGFSVIILLVFVGSQVFVVLGIGAYAAATGMNTETVLNDLLGVTLIIGSLISTPLCLGAIFFFAHLRKECPVKSYLALQKPYNFVLVRWLIYTFAYAGMSDLITHSLQRPIVPEFMINAYKTAYFLPALYFVLLVAAPLFEEFFFRGFLFKGIAHCRLKTLEALFPRSNPDEKARLSCEWSAVFITSLIWSTIHLQYDLHGILHIFFFGILLGYARIKTGSIYVPLAMHSFVNLVATVEVAIYVRYFL